MSTTTTKGKAARPRARGDSLATRLRRAGGEQWSLAGGTAVAVVHRSSHAVRAVLHGVFSPLAWETLMLRVFSERAERIELVVDPRVIMATCCRFAAEAVVRGLPAQPERRILYLGVPLRRLRWALELALFLASVECHMVPFLVDLETAEAGA